MAETVEFQCPCCSTRLVIDASSGEILSEERPKKDVQATFEKAMSDVRTGGQRREDAFTKAFDRTKNLDDLLEKKFEEAQKKASKDKSKPKNPFDME
jgi:hypothetical protein